MQIYGGDGIYWTTILKFGFQENGNWYQYKISFLPLMYQMLISSGN